MLETRYTVRGPTGAVAYDGDLETALEYVDDERFARGWTVTPSRHVIRTMRQMAMEAAAAVAARDSGVTT